MADRKFEYDRELHDHKRRVEMAETILADFYECADIVRAIRSSGSQRHEAAGRKRGEDESEVGSREGHLFHSPRADKGEQQVHFEPDEQTLSESRCPRR